MELKLHKNARTTPRIRGEIRTSTLSMRELAAKYNISVQTVHKWKHRELTTDAANIKGNLGQSTCLEEEILIIRLRKDLELSVSDISTVMREVVNPSLRRSSIYRCLKRYGLNRKPKIVRPKPGVFPPESKCGFIHMDLKQLTKLHKQGSYVFVAIDRATRYVYAEIIYNKQAVRVQQCLERFIKHFPHKVHTILTDNGKEFTNRRYPNPLKVHPFDVICKREGIKHRLTKPYHPQTNGMVERFNRRLAEALRQKGDVPDRRKNKFYTHDERNSFILNFISNYNNTKLQCLQYKAPGELLNNNTELYTE
jgi:transposase InsO family protein